MVEKTIRAIKRLRVIGLVEGISFLVLLLVAMPLKYLFHFPMPVRITGWIHGGLFILYIIAVLNAAYVLKLSIVRIFLLLLASLIPCAPFFIDRIIKIELAESINN